MQIHGFAAPMSVRPARAAAEAPVDGLAGSVEPGPPTQAQLGALLRQRETTGDELWRAQIPEGAQAAPSLGPQGQLAITTKSGVSVFSAEGQPLATINQTYLETEAAPAFDAQGNLYLTGDLRPGLRSYTPTGELRWKLDDLYGSSLSAVVEGDHLYYAEGTGWLNTLKTADGAWHAPALSVAEGITGTRARSLDRAPGDALILVNDKGHIVRVRHGKEEWRSRDSVRLGTRPLALGSDLLFCDNFGNLRRVDSQGQLVWGVSWRDNQRFTESDERVQVAGFGTTPVLSPDGQTLYVAQRQLFTEGPTPVSAFDLDGKHLWTRELPLPDGPQDGHLQVDRDGFLFVAGRYGGTIYCLDPQGEVQWRFQNRSQGQIHFAVHGDTLHVATESGWVHALQRDALRKELDRLGQSEARPTVVIQDGAVTVGGVRLKTRGKA